MGFLKYAMVLALGLVGFSTHAEIYMNLRPLDSLAAVKTKYPNASLVDMKPAWLPPTDSFKSLTGAGISGTIYIKFSTLDSFNQSQLNKLEQEIQANPTADNAIKQASADSIRGWLYRPVEERLTIDWVRWIPPAALPLQRFESKYGKPEKCDYKSDTFEPYCSWDSKGVSATLDDSKTTVQWLDFTFTAAEWGNAIGLPTTNTAPKSLKPYDGPVRKTRKAM